VFHEFHAPPYGGGNQFLLALVRNLRGRGLKVEVNQASGKTPVGLFNSFNFDFARLRRFDREGLRLVHRIDGPIGVYRGFDDGTDARIVAVNHEFAEATILQSRYSFEKHEELGLDLREPVVIHNTVDPQIFHPPATPENHSGPLRVIATSWSDNPRKGADILEWLDRNLADSIDFTFAGRTQARLERIPVLAPLPSRELADLLRMQDVYVAASRDDPCSNSLLEALACGLPAAYLRSGGHPELVGEAGIGFDTPEELPDLFAQLASELDERRAAINVPSLDDVVDRYLDVLRG